MCDFHHVLNEEAFSRLEPKSFAEDSEDVAYLKKNVEHLRFAKRRLEEKVQELESRCTALDQRKQQPLDLDSSYYFHHYQLSLLWLLLLSLLVLVLLERAYM